MKASVQFAHPDGQRLIPFHTYNMFYRATLKKRFGPVRRERMAVTGA
jgi:uncharacterized radical SAM superfamily Fe-S cluster-containing enzyme